MSSNPRQLDRKHLAIFIYGLTGGGATRRVVTLARGFAEHGHRVDLVVIDASGPVKPELPSSVRLVTLDSPTIRLAAWLNWRARRNQIIASVVALARYLRRVRPDLLMSGANHVHLTALWAWRVARVPIPLLLRVSSHLTHSHLGGGNVRRRPLRLRLARRWYAWADAVIAVSSGIAEDLVRHTRLEKECVYTVHNPTYTPDLLDKAGAPLVHPWFKAGGVPVLIAAGRLTAAKDFPTLLRAFAAVRRRLRVRLVILGEGKKRAELEAVARRLGVAEAVALPGLVDNPFAWMSRASLFVLSSAWEGSPGVLIEAMACGCPVVSTDCPSGPAEILADGAYGPLVPVGDDHALAEAIIATLDAPPDPDRLRRRAAEFSVERAVDRYLEIFLDRIAHRASLRGRSGRT